MLRMSRLLRIVLGRWPGGRVFKFRIIKVPSPTDPEGDLHLFNLDPVGLMEAVNGHVGSTVLEPCGSGLGLNLKLVDKDAWSDYISAHVDDDQGVNGEFTLTMPREKVSRYHSTDEGQEQGR
jgi:hypothetical protein